MTFKGTWKELKLRLEEYIKENEEIVAKYKDADSQESLDDLVSDAKSWRLSISDYFASIFVENDYSHYYKHPQSRRYNFGNKEKSVRKLIQEKTQDLASLGKDLKYHLRIFSISDLIVSPKRVDIEKRKKFSIDEKLELILEKLNQLYDDSYYSLSNILYINGIDNERLNEVPELAKILERRRLVDVMYVRHDANLKLTLDGKRYVENNQKKEATDYTKIDKSQEELSAKIDEIIDMLKLQGYANEVLFNEIEELKGLYVTLNKKNWGQVLKGKLVDLGIGQIINKEVAESIFTELTNQILRLK